ncbi:hypothetical protein [Paenibacillus sp. 32O-W]|uniref:hypothetical protein n=1 Tax=Paenibacillus sp. 32O-W TaxID=1695218 RepID=UPI0011A00145|nr:hypothetical protein [Paenibacillus sp. 32O-W]
MPNKPKPLEKGNIVETYQIGKTTVHICDDHVAKTQEEIEKVIDEMHTAGWKIIESAAEKGEAI